MAKQPKVEQLPNDILKPTGQGGTFVVPTGDETSVESLRAQQEYSATTVNLAGSDVELDSKAKTRVCGIVDSFGSFRVRQRQNWSFYDRLYHCVPTNRFYVGRANIIVPMAYRIVETWIPRLLEALFPRGVPSFDVDGHGNWEEKNAETVAALLRQQFEDMDAPLKFEQACRDLLIYGIGILKTGWSFERKIIYEKELSQQDVTDPKSGAVVGTKYVVGPVKPKEYVLDEPMLTVVDPFDYYADPRTFWLQETDIVQRIQLDETQLRQRKAQGVYNAAAVDAMLADEKTGDTQTVGQNLGDASDYRRSAHGYLTEERAMGSPREYTIFEGWCKFDINGDKYDEDCVLVLGNRKHVLRIQQNPFFHREKPFLVARLTPRTNLHTSMGIIEPFYRAFLELNDTRNQLMDAKTLALTPMWLIAESAKIANRELVVRPMHVIRGQRIDEGAIRPFTFPDISTAGWKAEEALRRDLEEGSGAVRVFSGNQMPPSDTPVGVITALITEANARIRQAAGGVEEQWVRPALYQFHSLNQQFMTREKVVRILGERGMEFRRVKPVDILGQYDFRPHGVKEMNARYTLAGQYQAFMQSALQVNTIQPGAANLKEVLKAMAESGFNFQDSQRFFDMTGKGKSQDAQMENERWLQGARLHVEIEDNHEEHTDPANPKSHVTFLQTPLAAQQPMDMLTEMYEHVNIHYEHLAERQEAMRAAAMAAAAQPMMPQGQQQGAGRGVASMPKVPGLAGAGAV